MLDRRRLEHIERMDPIHSLPGLRRHLQAVHLGTRDCKADQLNNFLKNNTCETLYLVGDIIDAWKIQQNRWRWRQSHTNVIRRILNHAKRGTRVVYIAGNHDEFLRPLLPYALTFGRVEIANQADHVGVDGRRYLVVHGDMFDGMSRVKKQQAIYAPLMDKIASNAIHALSIKAFTDAEWEQIEGWAT